jgi:hypothetical protein
MENESGNFDQLKKLLALKKHEQPPPGYYNNFSRGVTARLRAERQANVDPFRKLNAEAPWLVRFWQSLEARPAFAVGFGAAVCAVLLAGIFYAEKPASGPQFAAPAGPMLRTPAIAATPAATALNSDQPLVMTPTNSNASRPQNLFDLIQPGQSLPAAFTPPGN